MNLSPELRKDLDWLASNWEKKQLAALSPYNSAFYSALRNILSESASEQDLALVVEGTLGKVADGYALICLMSIPSSLPQTHGLRYLASELSPNASGSLVPFR
jgi:hypothetical protein